MGSKKISLGYFSGYSGYLGEQLMRNVIFTLTDELNNNNYSNTKLTVLLKNIKAPMEKNVQIIKAFDEKIVSNKKDASGLEKAGRTIKNAFNVAWYKTFIGSSRKTLIKNYGDISTKIKNAEFGVHLIVKAFCIGVAGAADRTVNVINANPNLLFTSTTISKDIL